MLAVVYGGFLTSEIFRDIDIAVFLGYKVSFEMVDEYVDLLKDEIKERIKAGIAIDIRALDYAPASFKVSVLSKGRVIVERTPFLATILKWSALQEINDFLAKRRKLSKLIGKNSY